MCVDVHNAIHLYGYIQFSRVAANVKLCFYYYSLVWLLMCLMYNGEFYYYRIHSLNTLLYHVLKCITSAFCIYLCTYKCAKKSIAGSAVFSTAFCLVFATKSSSSSMHHTHFINTHVLYHAQRQIYKSFCSSRAV